jgi:pantoate--beta-alanine ligase
VSRTAAVDTIAAMRRLSREARARGESLGLVPTMGALHAGHLALIARARAECDRVAVSLFVNPIQFNQAADLQQYPRTFATDLEACRQAGVDWLFAPSAEEMYPGKVVTYVHVEELTEGLCGAFRPGHFRGVATVVAKLFHIVEPDRAYFGEKDFQQLAVIRRMVRDLDFAVEIVPVETVREPDGLAMSSRNALLGQKERRAAVALSQALIAAQDALAGGERSAREVRAAALAVLENEPLARVEYVDVVDPVTLQPVARVERDARIALAVWIGGVRLIDNARLTPTDSGPRP